MWYVIQVQACHELAVVDRCQGIVKDEEEVFTMLSEQMERKNGEWQVIRSVAFQKYIFVDTANIDGFRVRLHSIPGMTRILTVGDDAVPIYPKEEKLLSKTFPNFGTI